MCLQILSGITYTTVDKIACTKMIQLQLAIVGIIALCRFTNGIELQSGINYILVYNFV